MNGWAKEGEVMAALRKAVADAGSQTNFASAAGVSVQFVNDMMKGKRAVTGKVLKHLGFERVVVFRHRQNPEAQP